MIIVNMHFILGVGQGFQNGAGVMSSGIGHGSMVSCAWESSVKVHWSGGVVTGLLGAYLPGSGARIVA
ncbi:hypothetical protein Tco_0826308 [Tanacetum coccineum]